MTTIANTPWIQALGWALIQFLWQGTVIWAAFAIIRALTRRRLGAHARYALACGALGAMAVTPLWTFHEQLVQPLAPALTIWSPTMWRSAVPWFVCGWMCGVLAFCWRLIDGWRAASRLRSIGTESAPQEWRDRLESLARRAGVVRPVRLLTSTLTEVPIIVGWWRPVILAPAAMLVGLPPQYLESMLAHELAHIRRADYLVNLFQGVVEAVLFYHPAVWWVSREIRFERERCCDDDAVKVVGDAWTYAQALAALEARRPAHRQALAANGGSLVERIRRLLGQAPTIEVLPGAGIMAAMGAVWLVGISAVGTHAAPSAPLVLRAPAPIDTVREATPSPRPALSSLLFAPIGPNVEPQTSAPTPNSALIIGRVVDADSGAAVAGAIVALQFSPASASGLSPEYRVLSNLQSQGGGFRMVGPNNVDDAARVLTGGDGRFMFRNLPAGRASFTVLANGYIGGAYHQLRPDGGGQSLDVAEGQHVSDITLNMWKDGAISGRVTDEAGEPIVGACVQVLRRSSGTGGWTLVVGDSPPPQTDDRGVYRVHGLLPGDYLVDVPISSRTIPISRTGDSPDPASAVASGRAGQAPPGSGPSGQLFANVLIQPIQNQAGGSAALSPTVGLDGRVTAYATTFYPAASTSSRAMILKLKSAEEKTGIDIQLAATHAFRISGTLIDVDGSHATNLAVHLLSLGDQNSVDLVADDVATTTTGPRGEFTMVGIPSGQYQLIVQRSTPPAGGRGGRGAGPGTMAPAGAGAPSAWARQSVSVGDADVMGLALTLHPAITVTGHVVFDGSATQPTAAQLTRGIRAQPLSPGVRGGRGGGAGTQTFTTAQVASDGSFTITGLMPGAYQFGAPGWPLLKWTPRSIVAGGRDVSDAAVDLDADLSGVVVSFTDRPGVLGGAVHRASGESDSAALVVGFPRDPNGANALGMHTFTQRVEADGTYSLPALAPGDYMVIAIPDLLAQNWQDADVLNKLIPLAVRVRIDEGLHVTQDLTTSTVR